jgi:hypothetical protein
MLEFIDVMLVDGRLRPPLVIYSQRKTIINILLYKGQFNGGLSYPTLETSHFFNTCSGLRGLTTAEPGDATLE